MAITIKEKIKHWWEWRWFRRNQKRLRNIAAWAMHYHAAGGSSDARSVLKGFNDRRIREAANGDLGYIANEIAKSLEDPG